MIFRRVIDGDLDLDAWYRETDPEVFRKAILNMEGVRASGGVRRRKQTEPSRTTGYILAPACRPDLRLLLAALPFDEQTDRRRLPKGVLH